MTDQHVASIMIILTLVNLALLLLHLQIRFFPKERMLQKASTSSKEARKEFNDLIPLSHLSDCHHEPHRQELIKIQMETKERMKIHNKHMMEVLKNL